MATQQVKALDSADLDWTSAQGVPRGELAYFHAKSGSRSAWLTFINEAADYPKQYREDWGTRYEVPDDEYWVPLGRVKSVPRDQKVKDADLEVMPVYPVRFGDAAGTTLTELRGGWLYIFLDGHLWREILVDRTGWAYRDVNLARYQGEDKRPTTVQVERNTVVLPYRMNGHTPVIEIAFSEVQWSWGYICALGGMADDDPRYLPDLKINQPYKNISASADGRAARCQRIDLSSYHAGDGADRVRQTFLMSVEAAIADNNHPTHKDGYDRPRLPTFSDDDANTGLPVLALQDPLAIAMDNLEAYYSKQAALIHYVGDINDPHQDPYRDSAVLAYHAFFDEKLSEKGKRVGSEKVAGYKEHDDAARQLRQASHSIDESYLKQLLHVEKRKQTREALRAIKHRHVLWLQGKIEKHNGSGQGNATTEDGTQRYQQFIGVHHALLDYAGLSAPDYISLYSSTYALIHLLSHDPCAIDGRYDLAQDRDAPPPDKDPGTQYLNSLLQASNPLNAVLFPTSSQVDLSRAEYDVANKKPEQPTASGAFRPIAFAASVASTSPNSPVSSLKFSGGVVKEGEKLVSNIILVFERQWREVAKGKSEIDIDAVVRLGKAANTPDMKGMHLIEKGESLKSSVVLDGDMTILPKLKRAQRREAFEKAVKDPTEGDRVNVIDPKTGEAVFSTELADLPSNTGWPLEVTRKTWSELWASTGPGEMAHARGRFVAVSDDAPYATQWHNPDLPASAEVSATVSATRALGKGLPPLVAVFELFNLSNALIEARGKPDLKSYYTALIAMLALPYAIVDCTAKTLGDDRAVRFWTRAFGGAARSEATATKLLKGTVRLPLFERLGSFRTLGVVGATFDVAGAVLAGWDMVDSFEAGDDDAGVAYSVQMAAGVGLAVASLGEASTAEIGLLVDLGPWGWAFLAVVLVAGFAAAELSDTELEKWAKHGPFAKDIGDRCTYEYAHMAPAQVQQALMTLLMAPKVTMRKDPATVPPTILVDVRAPGFTPGRSVLDIRATGQGGHRDAYQLVDWQSEQTPLRCLSWMPLLADPNDPLSEVGLRYRYALPSDTAEPLRLRARARHITPDQLVIPTWPDKPPAENDGSVNIDSKLNGWAYAKRLTVNP